MYTEDDYVEWARYLIKKNYPVPTKDIYKMAKLLESKDRKRKNAELQPVSVGTEESTPSTS